MPASHPDTGIFDPAALPEAAPAGANAAPGGKAGKPKRRRIELLRRSEIIATELPPGVMLVGDAHLFRGGIFVLGGATGVGKSRAAVALAVAGATGADWFGLKVHRRFHTLILQSENGTLRLKPEFLDLPPEIEKYVLNSKDTEFAFHDPEFRDELRALIATHQPDVVIIDPWGDAVTDNMEKEYRAAFQHIRECLPDEEFGPALFIVAHTRKPRMGERISGRGLLNLLSGSQVLGSKPRAAFVLQAASEDPEDDQVVFTCCKNNNGALGKPSAWRRRNGPFEEVPDFDWPTFYGEGDGAKNEKITEAVMGQVFDNGAAWHSKGAAVARLMELTGCGKSAAYGALDMEKSRFRERLRVHQVDGKLGWRGDGAVAEGEV